MRVLVIHNFHRKGSSSGDDQVFKSETALLEKNGHEVVRYTVCNDSFDEAGMLHKVFKTLGMLWSFENYKKVKGIIRSKRPDIVHVHTFFPLLSPSILYAAKKSGIKVVATLHDTRFVCPCATSLRGTQLCNECGDGKYFRMFKYGCFKNSKIQSLIVAGIFKFHKAKRSFYKQIDKYICLNENQITLLKNIGFEESKIVKKYNFVPDIQVSVGVKNKKNLPDKYVVFYGRIGEEKGIKVLQKIWEVLPEIPLLVMGGGPLETTFSDWAKNHRQVFYLGYVPHEECLAIVKGAEFVVFPSIWYEGCSMVEIEAESLGKALIATDLGFSTEAIVEGYNGLKVPLGNVELFVEKIKYLWNNHNLAVEMGLNARVDYEKKYQEADNYKQLIEIYNTMLKEE